MLVLEQFRANVLMHFWLAGVHVRQLVVVMTRIIYHVRWQVMVPQHGFQGTAHAQAFGVEITHGGFQRGVAHRLLNGPRVDTVLKAMSGITVPEFMRENRDAEFTSGFLDSALDIGLMHPIADFQMSAGMDAGVV